MPFTFHKVLCKNLKAFVCKQVIFNAWVSVYAYQIKHTHLSHLLRKIQDGRPQLEHVDLSSNEFQVMPSSALAEVSDTLRHLNLSGTL
jgi:hypothetical protein